MTALFIQAEGGGPAWQVWPTPDVVPPGTVREGASYLFELRDSEDALAADLLIDDVPVEALRSRHPRVARWRWQPGFHAGMVEAVLRIHGTGTRRFEITTDPDLRKLTRDDFDAMVREVLEDTFALFFAERVSQGHFAPARQPAAATGPARVPALTRRCDHCDGRSNRTRAASHLARRRDHCAGAPRDAGRLARRSSSPSARV